MAGDERDRRDIPVRLPIRVRRVELGDGQQVESCSVHCPLVDDSVTLDHCADCPRLGTVVPHLEEAHSSLLCSVPETVLKGLVAPTGPLGERLALAKVTEAMTTEVVCIDSELGLKEAAELLANARFRCAPVVEDEGVLVGMVCLPDLVQAQKQGGSLIVEEVMIEDALMLRESDTLLRAAELLSRSGHRDLPVVSRTDRVVGMISASDVVRWIDRERRVQEPG